MGYEQLKSIIHDLWPIGNVRIYKIVLKILGSEPEADKFMTSAEGGYTPGEVNRIKKQINKNKSRYNKLKN